MMPAAHSSEGYFNTTAMVCSGLMRRACVPGATSRDLRAYIDSVDDLTDADWRKLSLLVEETPRASLVAAVAGFQRTTEPTSPRRMVVKPARSCVACGSSYSYHKALCLSPGQWMCNGCAEKATAP